MDFDDKIKGVGITLRSLIIGIAIFILTMFVVVYGINIFYPSVEYEDYCAEFKTAEVVDTPERCVEVGGKWEVFDGARPVKIEGEPLPEGYCDRDYACRNEYEDAQQSRQKIVFIIAVPLGLILIALGAFVFHLNSVGLGVMFGGIGTLLYGAGGYWRYSENLFKFIVSLLALIILIWLAYRFNRKAEKKRR